MSLQHDPGGKVRLKLGAEVVGDATFSKCGKFRWLLERRMVGEFRQPFALWVGMNPSTADGEVDDPTVQREWNRTQVQFRLNRMVKMNLSPYRATDPKKLVVKPYFTEHKRNAELMLALAARASVVVMVHGVPPSELLPWAYHIHTRLPEVMVRKVSLGFTKDGWPRHPLYMKGDAPFVPWTPRQFTDEEAAILRREIEQ